MLPIEQLTSALISLIVGTLLGSELTRYLYRPRVFVRYKDLLPLRTSDGVHWTIEVANFGRTVASDCKGVITINGLSSSDLMTVSEAIADEFLPNYRTEKLDLEFPRAQHLDPDTFRTITNEELAWATVGNPAKIAINPGTTEKLDIFKIQHSPKGPYILVPSGSGWRKLRARIRAKHLEGRIMICPSNEFPSVLYFRLDFDDSGKSSFVIKRPSIAKRVTHAFFRRRFYYG